MSIGYAMLLSIYGFILALYLTIRLARHYEEKRENKGQVWLEIVSFEDGSVIGGYWAWED